MILNKFFLLWPHFFRIDGKCDRFDLNTLECGFEGGDCVKFNKDYPNCNAEFPYKVGGE
jgi:hypothetical protein